MEPKGNGDEGDRPQSIDAAADDDEERNAAAIFKGPLIRSAFRALVQDFSPIWFTWCMNAGVIGTLLHQLPYQFPGLHVLSTIAFTIDLVLYIFFSVICILHFVMYRQRAYNELVDNVLDLCLFPCWSIAFMTLVSFVTLTVSEAPWGGHRFTIVACVMWWIAATWSFGMLLFVFSILIQQHTILDRQLPTLIIIPAVGVATLAAVGGVFACFAHEVSAGLAVPVIIMSLCAVGAGIFLGLILYTYLLHQLLAKGWPAPPMTATLFILVGPMGQSAAALQLLGAAASTHGHFGSYDRGVFLTASAAGSLQATCIFLALLMTGLGAVWLGFALIAMLNRLVRRELIWAPTWNAIIFPTGTLTTATLLLGTDLDSAFFKIVTVIQVIFLILVFFINAAFTLLKIWRGELLIVREDPRLKQVLGGGKPKAT
ncbi:uncharacterized protein Z520_03518 [Fonsecaea multimorphosa CBS 102226]|uniref:Sulfite efflux pump SSU1 n=1 Tax=Fonsecaea multimorphosa CBS 102226 TaxID=1442371 RepID=A0A0D2IUW1_9EURO|nr:uncharacterized protein Z520_03518 [Fonsecaea multimorphosa CBS 102226]KIY00852.1 hypothetical protein Z520_03518 [Fonsecaea multimorphosa CBS 102226]